uniref:Uncharacterized protein LOC104239547 n=1 Tax=Nicotiana sylvestris TaxID=4096 RepID=A0A1U7XSB5_NICSY|nr:PREDICTED: uncharacterized protein LOC104239547 [Nicotiana sylvestris]
MGDFNAVLNMDDRIGGNPATVNQVMEFQDFVESCGLLELPPKGSTYTWSDRHEVQRMLSKIDWAFINNEWLLQMPAYIANYLPAGISDHSPIKVELLNAPGRISKPFKYCNIWATHPKFLEVVTTTWQNVGSGYAMLQVVKKLKSLKRNLKVLNKQYFRNIITEAEEDRTKLGQIWKALQFTPRDQNLQLKDVSDVIHVEPEDIARLFVEFYQELLGSKASTRTKAFKSFLSNGHVLTFEQQMEVLQPNSNKDVNKAMFSIDNNKSFGPNGYINATNITLIPKASNPEYASQFRPISCCNTLYKCISEVPCERLKQALTQLVAENQATFVTGRTFYCMLKGYRRVIGCMITIMDSDCTEMCCIVSLTETVLDRWTPQLGTSYAELLVGAHTLRPTVLHGYES